MHLEFRDPRQDRSPPETTPSVGAIAASSSRSAPACDAGPQLAAALSAAACFQKSRLLTRPITVLLRRALVVRLLALGEPDLQLGQPVLPVEAQRNQGVAFALDRADQ